MTEPDFSPEVTHLLACAAAVCTRNGARLTRLRRLVLGLVMDSPRPVGAYDLLQRLAAQQGRTAPPTVYRALDFLIGAGLVHKVERLAAYIACTHHLHHDHGHGDHAHSVQFLICTGCGRAEEMEDPAVAAALQAAAGRVGFRLGAATVEAEGRCGRCAAADASQPGD